MKLESMDADELFQVLEEHELHTQIPDYQWPIELIQYWPLKLTHPSVRLFYIPGFCFSR